MNEQKPDEFEGFVGAALRGPRRGIYEQLLAALLVKASSVSNNLTKIASLCEAAYLSRNNNKLDMNFIKKASAVCTSLLKTELNQKNDPVRIPWVFPQTKENWMQYIKPWQKITLVYYPLKTPYRRRTYPLEPPLQSYRYPHEIIAEDAKRRRILQVLQEIVHKEIEKLPEHRKFFECTAALSRDSFLALKGEFERWALFQLLPIQARLAEEIDPRIYREVVQLLKKETETEGEQELESPME